jgi:8-oxo-dGTP diphosphatase
LECCIRHKNKILFQKRPDTSKNFPGFWTFPGGHIDKGEDALTSIIREIKEETGIIIKENEIELKVNAINYHINKNQTWIIFGFLANIETFQETNNTEEGKTQWFNLEALKDLNIFPPIKYYLEFITQDNKAMLFMSAECENSELKNLLSKSIVSHT